MLRTRLYLGLLPLLLLIVATGGYAIHRVRNLAGSLSRDLVGNYRAVLACQQMRTSATLMTSALSPAVLGEAERKAFEDHRAAFKRELMAQSATSVGSARANLIAKLDAAFVQLSDEGERLLRAGGGAARTEAMQSSNNALFRVLQSIEDVTKRDFAAAQQTASRVEHLATETERVMLITIAG